MRRMKKVLLGIASVLALAIVVVLAVAATKPSTFRIERSAQVNAPATAVYANLEDFHRWKAWSPWEGLDPNLKRDYSGKERGEGAVYSWQGNPDVGSGRMTVVEAKPDRQVNIRLEFFEPFAADNRTIFKLEPSSGSTQVNWAMEGSNNFMGKLMSVFMDMDSMVGKDFERGLDNLKRVSESGEAAAAR